MQNNDLASDIGTRDTFAFGYGMTKWRINACSGALLIDRKILDLSLLMVYFLGKWSILLVFNGA
jgi:hypothetical protein